MPWSPAPTGFHFGFGHFAGFGFEGFVHAHGDIAGLFGDSYLHAAGVAVESFFARVVTDLVHHAADERIVVEVCVRGDLAQQHDEAGLGGGLARDARARILLEAGVQHRVGDLIAHLVGVSLRH